MSIQAMYRSTYYGKPALLTQIASGLSPWQNFVVAIGTYEGSGFPANSVVWHPGSNIAVPYMKMVNADGSSYFHNWNGRWPYETPVTTGYGANTLLLYPLYESGPEAYVAWPLIMSASTGWWFAWSAV